MSEFSLIDRYCREIGVQHSSTKLGVGDDAAVISVPPGKELAISVDTMVKGVHFDANSSPADLARKLLAVNLSDMAAMGATPMWATLSLTMPDHNDAWLSEFSKALNETALRYQVQLIGGDTTQGPLALCLQIIGVLPAGQALIRAGAQVGDDVYVSGVIGDPALALACRQQRVDTENLNVSLLEMSLDRPEPQSRLGSALLGVASACIDISDGLVADLSHIARQSKVALTIDLDRLPVSVEYAKYLNQGGDYDLAATGGDDYQLAFTVAPDRRNDLFELTAGLNVTVSRIGSVKKMLNTTDSGASPVTLRLARQAYRIRRGEGYQHFDSFVNKSPE